MTRSVTSLAAKRMTAAMVGPKELLAAHGEHRHGQLAMRQQSLLSIASWSNAANWVKPARIAPGCA